MRKEGRMEVFIGIEMSLSSSFCIFQGGIEE
jgi:hypothetical protein